MHKHARQAKFEIFAKQCQPVWPGLKTCTNRQFIDHDSIILAVSFTILSAFWG